MGLYLRSRCAVLFIVMLAVVGCGRASHEFNDVSGVEVQATGGSKLRRELNLDYSLAGYPSKQCLSLVPMQTEDIPNPFSKNSVQLEVTEVAGKLKVRASVSDGSAFGDGLLVTHLRYDPGEWQAETVVHRNPWPGAAGIVPLAYELEPGILLLASAPTGAAGRVTPSGLFAEITMQAASGRKLRDFQPAASGCHEGPADLLPQLRSAAGSRPRWQLPAERPVGT